MVSLDDVIFVSFVFSSERDTILKLTNYETEIIYYYLYKRNLHDCAENTLLQSFATNK